MTFPSEAACRGFFNQAVKYYLLVHVQVVHPEVPQEQLVPQNAKLDLLLSAMGTLTFNLDDLVSPCPQAQVQTKVFMN